VNDSDKPNLVPIARRFDELGFKLHATEGTRRYLRGKGIQSEKVFKVHEEGHPHAIDLIINRQVQLLINTPLGKHAHRDDYSLRQAAIAHHVPYTTTLSAANAAIDAVIALRSRQRTVQSLQEWQAAAAGAAV
jgi:carbamoyl-phosphate synthase large subunit